MISPYDKTRQFRLTPKEFLAKLDLLNWHRYFAIVKELASREPKSVLEVGPGEGTIKRVWEPFTREYVTMDVNKKLGPSVVGDIRTPVEKLKGKFEAVIAADILEHIPFSDLETALHNLHGYLGPRGYTLITIPHRSHYIFGMTSLTKTHSHRLLRIPTLKKLLGRKVSIDPDHQWEIGDGAHGVQDVETIMRRVGFTIERREKLPYVDFWVLRKKPA